MATEAPVNDGSSAASDHLSPAQKLQEKHAAEAAHRATIEDAIDEEDIIHPPPSMHAAPEGAPAPILVPAVDAMSDRAAGKQKASEELNGLATSKKPDGNTTLDMKSEESFPALGGGPKPQAQAPVARAWGAKKPGSVGNAGPNGANGVGSISSTTSSRASTPASGVLTPSSTTASVTPQTTRGLSMPQYMPIPGRHSERIQFAPSQLLPRDQLKKPLPDVLRAINKRSKATVEMKPGPNGAIIFEGTGPVDHARQALKEVAKEVGSKQTVKIPIPLSVRSHIIGRQGTVVQAIQKRTGARVQVPRAEEVPTPDMDDDDSRTIDVSIEGDAVAAEMARREIEAIIHERTSTVNMRLRDIPAEFFPFLAGPHNSSINALENGREVQVQIPQYHTWSSQPPPQAPPSGMQPQFVPDPTHHIRISGDRVVAQEVRSAIERRVEYLRRQITLSQLAIDRGRHQFILGDSGRSLHDLLQDTGCAVILPPASDDTEMLTITGPHDKIESGIEKVMNLASSMQMSSVDVARQHANAPMGSQVHARALTRYLQQRRAIEQLERQYDARIVVPVTEDSPMNWEIYSRDGKNTIRARSDIINLINAHPPTRLRHVEVNPFFHQHVHQQSSQHVRDNFGVHLLLPDLVDQQQNVVLVYEGPSEAGKYQPPSQRPSPQEVAAFEKALCQAQEHILNLVQGQREIGAAIVEVPPRFHEKVRKFVRIEQQKLPPTEIPVQLSFGSSKVALNGAAESQQDVSLRGPSDAVEDLAEKIVAFIEAEKQDEKERGYVTSFDFPQKYANFLIGKRGENINKYREEFDVDIQVNEGKIEIKGPKAKAEVAKSKIQQLGKKLEDEATHVLKIKPQYHRDMIGAKGSQVNRLQDRYNVRVQFPRTVPAGGDDRSVADGASDVGGPRNGRANQALDEVIIRGPKKGADEARDELLNLLQWTIDNSHTATVSVSQTQLPSLIGQGGREMENIRLATGAQIDVPGSRESADPTGRVQIQIKGTKKSVEEAKKLLEERAKVFDDSVTKSIDVDKKHHKALIGSGGANIRHIVVEAGGSNDRRDLARTVRFPRQDSNENTIRVEGNKALVESIIASIEAFVDQRDNQTTQIVEVAPDKHRLLIGRGGETRRTLESQFKVNIDVPKLTQEGPGRSQVKLSGQPGDVEKARDHILALVKDQEGETLQVPRRLHHSISDNGQFFRRLRNDHGVTVDHAGQHPPSKPVAIPRSQANGGADLPLITDDPSSMAEHSWEVVDNGGASTEDGEIPWILRGSSENVARARAVLHKAIEQAQQQQQQQDSSIGYLVLPDPRTYRFVVGQGGSQINSIRKQTGCKITVPRDQAKGAAIEILGSKEGVEQAKDIILDVVQNGGNGNRRE